MNEARDLLPRTVAVIEEGIEQRLHTGVQVYVSLQGQTMADFGVGEARPGVPLTAHTIMHWLSSGKPLTAVALARLWEQGTLDLDDLVVRFIPQFGSQGKEAITVRHLLTHTAAMKFVNIAWPELPWNEVIHTICRKGTLRARQVPGRAAAYHPQTYWFLLGEILRRQIGKPFPQLIREELCNPLGMHETWAAYSADQYRNDAGRMAIMSRREQGEMQPRDLHTQKRCEAASPGSSFRGPIRELGRFYEMLLNRGRAGQGTLITPQTVEALTARHRVGLFDETFQHVVDFGLGFVIDSNQYGAETVPYGYGRSCSPRTFGHGGAQSSIGFADPELGLVVAVAANGMPGEPRHNRRSRAINEAIYKDLELTETS